MSQLLVLALARGISHNVLNANHVAREAQIIAVWTDGAVTVATSMAGRGTDIQTRSGVADLGGFDCDWYESGWSRRIDLQIRGRSGRQGDPGMSQFFVSLEDDVIKKFGPSWVPRPLSRLPSGRYPASYPISLSTAISSEKPRGS